MPDTLSGDDEVSRLQFWASIAKLRVGDIINSLPQETNTMFNRFLQKLKVFRPPALNITAGTKTIDDPGRISQEVCISRSDMPTELLYWSYQNRS